MNTVKYFILGLLFLISLTAISNIPGTNFLENYQYTVNHYISADLKTEAEVKKVDFLIKYPPGIYLVISHLFASFNPDSNISVFYKQNIWLASKVILYIFYLFTRISIIYFIKTLKLKTSYLDASLAYFGSITILIASVGQISFDILAAPFLIFSLAYFLRGKMVVASLIYLSCLFINWNLFFLAPLLGLIALKNYQKLGIFSRAWLFFSFLLAPIGIFLIYLFGRTEGFNLLSKRLFLSPVGYPNLISTVFDYIADHGRLDNLGWGLTIFIIAAITSSLVLFFKGTLFFNQKQIRRKVLYLVIVAALVIYLAYSNTTSLVIFLQIPLILSFLTIILLFILKLKALGNITQEIFLGSVIFLTLIQMLFFPDLLQGGWIWPVLMSILFYVVNPSNFTRLFLLVINLLTFMIIFLNSGVSGYPATSGTYFDIFKIVFSSSFILFIVWYASSFYRSNFFSKVDFNKYQLSPLKWFIVGTALLISISLIPVVGSPDHVAWTEYALASVQHLNPFRAYADVILQYPPLSIVIISVFANAWNVIIGESADYTIAIKISIFVFYILSVLTLLKLTKTKDYQLSTLDKLLIILTTFSLIVQTQGLADINIYVIPTLFLSIFLMIKKKYLLSGLLFGITISIKWQPIILLPLFVVTLINLREISNSLKQSLRFGIGFIIIPILVWTFALIQPGGVEATVRAFEFILHGAAMLSGQALNLNWIVTYIMHIFEYRVESLEHLGGLNRQIPTPVAPLIFQGPLFLIVWALIVIRYWLKQKKDLINFLAASIMIFFAHHQLNKSAYEKHIFYVVILMLFLYLVRPTQENRLLLILFDIMVIMNLVFFYGFTGPKDINRMFFGFDITIIFSAYYLIIFGFILWRYFKNKNSADFI